MADSKKIVWDEDGKRFYETGVSKGVLYPTDANGKYKAGVAWNGLTSIQESIDGGDTNDFWADNIKYVSLRGAENFKPTISAYTYPDEFAECDGSASPTPGVSIGQQVRKTFGLCYRTEVGNDQQHEEYGYKLHLVWNATCSPSDREYQSINDSPDAIEFSWECDTTPVPVTGYKPTAHMEIDTTKLTETTKAHLSALEDKLYGTTTTDPMLPTPDQVIALITTGEMPAA